jgi:type II secretory pathway component HofQ
MVPSQWKHVIADLRINKHFTVVETEQPHFKDLGVVERTMKQNQNLKITEVLRISFSADDSVSLSVNVDHEHIYKLCMKYCF